MWGLAGASLHVTARDQFLPTLHAILEDKSLQTTLAEQRHAAADRYMRLDGHATQRILDLLNNLRGENQK
jgi:hypothetical protein